MYVTNIRGNSQFPQNFIIDEIHNKRRNVTVISANITNIFKIVAHLKSEYVKDLLNLLSFY